MLPGEAWSLRYSVNGWPPTYKFLLIHNNYLNPAEWIISSPCFCRLHFYHHSSDVSLLSNHFPIPGFFQFHQRFFLGFCLFCHGNKPEFPEEHGGIDVFSLSFIFCLLSFIFCLLSFCLVSCVFYLLSFNFYLSQSNSPCQPFILGKKGNRRGFTGGSMRVRRGVPHWTLTEPSLNPHWTLTEPPLNYTRKKRTETASNC